MRKLEVKMDKRILKVTTIFFVVLFVLASAFAYSPPIENGISWLSATQNPDGSWGNNADFTILDTSTVLDTFKYLNVSNSAYSNGVTWLSSQSPLTTDFLSRKVISLYMAGTNVSTDLSTLVNRRNLDGGWGGDADSTSMINDTALALQAIKAVNYSDQTIIESAINYLLSTQNTDGGWGFYQGDDSNVYMTALASITLQQFPRTTSIATAINKATSYLIAHQNTDGGFGVSPSTIYETSLAYLALVGETTDATVLGNAINYLTSTQLPNGSWDDDPYSTALALRALANVKPNLSVSSSDITFSNPTPTAGETITISANIKNTGSAQADNIVVQFYDGDPAAGGVLIGETTITSIPSFGSSQASIQWTVPNGAAHSILVKIDPANSIDEADENDNIASKSLTASTLLDLSIKSADIDIFPPCPDPYIMVGIFIKVRNLGGTDAADVLVEVYDGNPSAGGVKLPGSGVISLIPAGGVANVTAAIAPENVTGVSKDIYVLVDPNNTISEANETNNVAVKTFNIGASLDLYVSSSEIVFNPPNPKEGDIVQITATVRNSMLARAKNVKVRFYLGNPYSGGTQIGSDSIIPEISSYGVAAVSTTWDTTWHFGYNDIYASVDPDDAITEDYENNNTAFKTIRVDASRISSIRISALTTDKTSYKAYEDVLITAVIENQGNTEIQGRLLAEIRNAESAVVAFAPMSNPDITLSPLSSIQTDIRWNTDQISPGNYKAVLRLTGTSDLVLAMEETPFTILPSVDITNSAIKTVPSFTHVGVAETVTVSLSLTNRSNIPANLRAEYEVKSPSGTILNNGTTAFSLPLEIISTNIPLTTFMYTFSESGEYPINVTVYKDGEILANTSSILPVLSNIRIDLKRSVTPETILPEGNGKVKIIIELKGVEEK